MLIAALVFSGCSRSENATFTLEGKDVVRVNGCHLSLDHVRNSDGIRRAGLRYACGAPESAIREEQWWGNQPRPLLFTVDAGDCILLDTMYYCLEDTEHARSATFKAKYKKNPSSDTIRLIQ